VWEGGLAIYGGVLAGLLTGYLFARKKKIPVLKIFDILAAVVLIGQVIGRWANFINREAFGCETTLPWRMKVWITHSASIEVHPTFFYESLWNLIGLLLLLFVVSKARRFDGENTCFYFLWYGLGRAWIEGLRTDSLYLFDWTLFGERIRVSQALSALLAVGAAAVLIWQIAIKKRTPESTWARRREAERARLEDAEREDRLRAGTIVAETKESKTEEPFHGDQN
ncbi:MAG: prolipoprotein diacylglyceryl transferase, partial [Oscillibacter sp.]|nr:prolipoprotein diacylglyceryl transferase [Oscillibacter sp.]